jgi:hypothetical protein
MSFLTTSSVNLRPISRLPLGRLADQHLAVLRERDDRGGCPVPFAVLDHFRLAAFHDRDARIGGAEIDANHLAHM